MKTKVINLYQFHELPEKTQDIAVKNLWDINVDHNWWEFVYEEFARVAGLLGITVDLKKTYFSGFYHQGQGSAFYGQVDVVKLIRFASAAKPADTEPFHFQLPKVINTRIRRIVALVESGAVKWDSETLPIRDTSIQVNNWIRYRSFHRISPHNVEAALDETEQVVTQLCQALNRSLFRALRREFDWLTDRTAVVETILANEYYFTEQGKLENDQGS